jgi:hypothetical protein
MVGERESAEVELMVNHLGWRDFGRKCESVFVEGEEGEAVDVLAGLVLRGPGEERDPETREDRGDEEGEPDSAHTVTSVGGGRGQERGLELPMVSARVSSDEAGIATAHTTGESQPMSAAKRPSPW